MAETIGCNWPGLVAKYRRGGLYTDASKQTMYSVGLNIPRWPAPEQLIPNPTISGEPEHTFQKFERLC